MNTGKNLIAIYGIHHKQAIEAKAEKLHNVKTITVADLEKQLSSRKTRV